MNKQGNAIKKFIGSPLTRISFGLVMLTASVMFISDLLGLIPDNKGSELQARKAITEMLAVQLTTNIQNNYLDGVNEAVDSVVERNDNVLSGAVRLASGEVLVQSGQHHELWDLAPTDKSTPTQIQVSLFNSGQRWGNLELRFADMGYGSSGLSMGGSFIYLVLFISLVGFVGYRLFLNRALRELNPEAVIPERVRKALDTLSEGLIIVDKEGVIIFSNMAFAQKTGFLSEKLVGKDSGSLDWAVNLLKGDSDSLPWMRIMAGETLPQGQRLNLTTALKETLFFNVNVSPVTASEDEIKGALVTFDDVTELESKNESLREAMGRLEESQQEILIQNEELLRLATRDPLTNALNRRALFEMFEVVFTEAVEEESELCCLMVDIDHFKLVNDTYGHGVGDEAIKFMCDTLTQYSRPNDLVGRLGGEEFVVVLPKADVGLATAIGEKMRKALEAGDKDNYPEVPHLTASFGLVSIYDEAVDAKELLNQSDEALYVAKETGRNRLIRWSLSMHKNEQVEVVVSSATAEVVNGGSVGGCVVASNEPAYGNRVDNDSVLDSQLRKGMAPAVEKVSLDPVQCPPEKALLLERINQAIARVKQYESKVALMIVDIEALQRVNDTLGTLPTEKFAKTIIVRIKEAVQKVDAVCQNEDGEPVFTVSRFNGNEIAVLLPDLDKSTLVTSFIYSIFSISNEPVVAESNQFYLNANIGVGVYPSHGNSADELLRNASSAMQEAKQKHDKNNFQFYSKEIGERAKQKIQLEADLYRAIENSELAIHYQPRVDLNNGQILGLEALTRWHHPQLGLVSPDDFIPLAEQTGLIRDITKWLVQTASLQIKAWREMGYASASVSINLSPVEFRDPDLADQIITVVREIGIPPDALEFEITESVVMYSVDATAKILDQLYHAGFALSLDDFGTGYSSLSYLKSFPVRKVKIDRSFIHNIGADNNDAAIVSGIISMAHSMDLQVVAEGVEKEEQLRYLQDLQCDEVQGYLLGGALSADKATNLLDDPSSVQRMVVDSRNDNLAMLDAGENKIVI